MGVFGRKQQNDFVEIDSIETLNFTAFTSTTEMRKKNVFFNLNKKIIKRRKN